MKCWLTMLCVAAADPASAASFLAIDDHGRLYDIDTQSVSASSPRGASLEPFFIGIARAADGTLYTARGEDDQQLYTVDETTGAKTLVGAIGLADLFEGDLAFDPETGNLLGFSGRPLGGVFDDTGLFTLDTDTAAATVHGPFPDPDLAASDFPSAMAFDSTGVLYALGTDTEIGKLYTVDVVTGAAITSVALSQELASLAGMAFDPDSGVLYVVAGSAQSSLYTLDPSTGTLGFVGLLGANALSGLVFAPEPRSEMMLLASLLTLLAVRRILPSARRTA